jgi:hypothetical protein
LLETGNADYSKALSDINTEFNDKVLDCGMVYRNIQVEAEVYKTESKRLADKANSLEKRAEGLRVYVEQQMQELNIESIKGSTFTVKFRKLPPMVQIDDLDKIPASYKRIIPLKVEPDKVKLLEDLSAGIKIEGAHLSTDRRKLEIK